ncbi:nitroreductase [Cryobacterium sp. MLB-32]|uniref:nitroreductase family protein n=1 Tax=Cryobacterium sp. MLB-32 TaxID=1529318 RepID=UPI0004E6D673|nr:nitroreductase family protein [Cryobacterium sp. MLB-32]KFF59563.1 nitroreductase [Cryobacterium sp. MLB-32]
MLSDGRESGALAAVANRRSHSQVTAEAPTRAELLPLVAAAARAADHAALRPWRLIEVRGEARDRLGEALVTASACTGEEAAKLRLKPLRAPLLIAIVACRRDSSPVQVWEQDAAAVGVAHLLSLLLTDAGWGVMWRTGPLVRTEAVRLVHRLERSEELLGWLYVGGVPADCTAGNRAVVNPANHLSVL